LTKLIIDVPYIDWCSAVSSFPKKGFFMSTWGMENYLAANRPVMKKILETEHPVFLVANKPLLDTSIPRINPFTKAYYALLEPDYNILKDNFIPHWGPVWVAGKSIQFKGASRPHSFDILIPGIYTIEASGPIILDGLNHITGDTITLTRGSHTVLPGPEVKSMTIRWGKHLYRPDGQPLNLPSFYGF